MPLDLSGPFTAINTILNNELLECLGLQHGEEFNHTLDSMTYQSEELLEYFNIDIRWIIASNLSNLEFNISQKRRVDGKLYFYHIDEWGITRVKPEDGYWFDIVNSN